MIDEIGYLSYDNRNADLLFQVVSRRYERKSVVITSNLAFADWPTIFPNAACTTALIDRLVHHSEIISIEGESYRKREFMPAMVHIRRAVESDCPTICGIDVRSRQWGYCGLLPGPALAGMKPEDREPLWRPRLSATSTHRIWIAEGEARGLGFAAWGPPSDVDLDQRTVELHALYLERDASGTGIAQRLVDASLREMREEGYAHSVLWVLKDNPRARCFYERAGWSMDGSSKAINRCGKDLESIRYTISIRSK